MSVSTTGSLPAGDRAWRRGILVCAAVLVFVCAVTKVTSYDTWVHLSLGRWMAEHGQVPRHNLLSYTAPERPTVDHQWLFQVCLYGLWRTVGLRGAVLAKAAVVAAAFGFAMATACRKGSTPLAAAAVVLLAAFAARFRFTLRPQVAGFLLLSVQLYVLERWRGGRWRGLLVLLPLQVLWANLHGSAVLGCAVPLAYAAGESLRALGGRRLRDVRPVPRPSAELAFLWGIALVLVPLTLVNPNGVSVLREPIALASVQKASGLKEFLLDRSSLVWAELWGRHVLFTALAGLGLVALAGSLVRKDVTEAGLLGGLLWAAVHSQRFVGVFAVAAAPVVARNLSGVLAAARRLLRRNEGTWSRGARGVVAVVCLYAVLEVGWRGATGEQPTGLGPAPGRFPEAEVEFVRAHHPTGNLFNEFEHGGYIHWKTRRPVFIDSRGLLAYEAPFVRAYVGAWSSSERWRELCERHDVTVALVARPGLQKQFRIDPRWVLAYQGQVCAVFVRAHGAPAREASDVGHPPRPAWGHTKAGK